MKNVPIEVGIACLSPRQRQLFTDGFAAIDKPDRPPHPFQPSAPLEVGWGGFFFVVQCSSSSQPLCSLLSIRWQTRPPQESFTILLLPPLPFVSEPSSGIPNCRSPVEFLLCRPACLETVCRAAATESPKLRRPVLPRNNPRSQKTDAECSITPPSHHQT